MKLTPCIVPLRRSLPTLWTSIPLSHVPQRCVACNLSNRRNVSDSKNIVKSNKPFKVLNVDFNKNETFKNNLEYSNQILDKYQKMMTKATSFGGEKGIERHVHKQKKMLVTDRLKHLLDDPDDFLELSLTAGIGMEYGDVPRAGIISGIGKIHGKFCMILANDATVKGGTIYPVSLKKQLRAQEIAEQNRLPVIYVIESGGAFLPLQSMIFPDKNQGGRSFYNQAVMSAMGIPQIAIVCGSCTAGGAYVPTMSDEAVIIHKHGTIFLGGPPLVQAATGEIVSAEELGGATMHCTVSGCTDYFAATEREGLDTGRDIVASLNLRDNLPSTQPVEEPLYYPEDILGLITKDNSVDIYQVIARLVDGSRFHEFKAGFGSSLVTGFAYLNGYLVGVLGNNGDLTEFAADKGAHFVTLCEERRIPLIFLQNTHLSSLTMGDSVGLDAGNRLRGHAKMMSAVSCTTVPKITIIIGNGIGPTSFIMGGKCTSPNFLFCWPNSVVGLTSPTDAIQMLCQEKFQDSSLSDEDKAVFQKKITEKSITETSAFYVSSRVLNDGLILPQETRKVLHKCLEVSLVYAQPAQLDNAVIRM